MRTSEQLRQGEIYTRQQLRDLFGIADKTLDTGIFKPADHESVWLFVTEKKSPGMTKYEDLLDGDTLYWQGQTAGLKDPLIEEHVHRGLELLLFYRPENDAYPNHGFRLEGPFEYASHSGSHPTSFVLRRAGGNGPPHGAERGQSAERGGPSRVAPDLVEVLGQLRQSGREAVVAEGALTHVQQQMHVPDAIEDWVGDRVARWRDEGRPVPLLLVLSGNAGDGKSDLIERLRVRPEVAGDDLDVIADATHSDSPSESQAERLRGALSLFQSDEPDPPTDPRCVLVAMNVGMVIAFFASLEDPVHQSRFASLRRVLESSLGLAPGPSGPPSHWQCEVVNLDYRNLLGRASDGLVAGMLRKLDPEEPHSLTHDAAGACGTCPVRGSCWVRTNLSLLRMPAVEQSVHELLWEVTLSSDLHLSPRNVWDLLFQVTTGGMELSSPGDESAFLSCDWMRANLPDTPQAMTADQLTLVQRRLIYHLFFEPPRPDQPSRGPILEALASADPIRRGGKHTHLAEGEVRAAPSADSEALSTLALQADQPDEHGERVPDPLLDGLASLASDPVIWHEAGSENGRDLALGVSRRARLTALPPEVQAEVLDEDAREFLALLHDYALWKDGESPSASVNEFWLATLVGGVGKIFGVEVEGNTYFRLDTLSPATRFPAFVPVELKQKLSIRPDSVTNSNAPWLGAVAYLPRTVTATIDAGGAEPWPIPIDLRLFRLLSHVSRGYSASSVDLDAFFRLRYACERLGATDATGEIVFKALSSGDVFRLEREQQLAGWEIGFSRVDG